MTSRAPVGVIAGTGVAENFDLGRQEKVRTAYGTVAAYLCRDGGYVLITRHGPSHEVPRHGVNYRANIAALGQLGVTLVFASSAVGSMNAGFGVGEVGLVEQFLDFTRRRPTTFFEREVVHTDMTRPYSERLYLELADAAKRAGV